MRPTLWVCVLMVVCVGFAHGHAVLVSPVPYNPSPTTQPLCGVSQITATMASTAQATWVTGTQVNISWHLIAEDGGGNLYGAFDPLGGTNFTVLAWTDTFPTSGAPRFYTKVFTVPSISCDQSPTKLCTFRVYTASKWNSCTTIKIVSSGGSGGGSGGGGNSGDSTPPVVSQCAPVPASSSGFCNTTTNAMVDITVSAQDLNNELISTYNFNRNNLNVFSNGNSSACMSSYQQLLCSIYLPSCNPATGKVIQSSVACHAQCEQTMTDCGVVNAHLYLYDCSSYPLCEGEADPFGSKGSKGMSAGGKAALSLFIIALVGGVAVAGYLYHTQGHLAGYTFDKEQKRFVKVQANPHNYTAYVDPE